MFPVEIFRRTLEKFVGILTRHSIRFHLTGGVTGTAYGEPRMTQDIDVVIDPATTRDRLDSLLQSLKESDFLFDERSVREAVANGGMFQLLDQVEVLKLDVYPRELIPGELDRSELLAIFEGRTLPVVSRVDAAASKLIWVSKGSHKSRRDLRAIARTFSADQADRMRELALSLGLTDLLIEVLGEPDELQG